MIIVRITSGLGNQMFQYAFYRLMQERYPETEVRADVTWFHANDDHHGYELERIFADVSGSDFMLQKATTRQLLHVTGLIPNIMTGKAGRTFEKIRRYPNRIIRECTQKKCLPQRIDELELCFGDGHMSAADLYGKVMNLDTTKDWYLAGFWIEEMYYRERLLSGQLQRELKFPAFSTAKHTDGQLDSDHVDKNRENIDNAQLAADMNSCNSVSIHVRRGDYLTTYSSDFIALGREYYEQAVAYMNEHVESPVYYIFSDDIEFIKKEFTWLQNYVVVTGNEGVNSFRDMQLMSYCKHNIIANSTFSQWGAFLNQNAGHITIYPRSYMRTKDNEVKTIPGWVML
ncbi:MAG: alpha-1,2-fucosyltransferase [bacterium]|nr:alpha-1,2-fucosyltransferase [bacterium]